MSCLDTTMTQKLLKNVHAIKKELSTGGLNVALTRFSDLFLVACVAMMVGLMIVPLPTWLLDICLTVNIAMAMTILMVSIYISSATKIASYPTLLLITTLYRLSLDISATRLILLKADAGEVIRSFGMFVVGGNFVVGAVIFLIITLVQFIVITKGAERVAEVGARFTLDAMPGKQMSIDADLRSGTIDSREARRRRQALSRESQFYGAMDGAMKFVKGDAIAGIIITVINIVGGLVIGVAMGGMSFSEAGQTYSILTIGNGLVSQIPALLISLSAGMVVTRVAAEDETSNLGREIAGQLLSQPKAIGMVAGIIQYLVTGRHLGNAGKYPASTGDAARDRAQKRNGSIALMSLLAILAVLAVFASKEFIHITAEEISDGLGWILVVPLGLAILILAFFGTFARWMGRVPSAVWGGEYFYPMLFLFVLGVTVLFAQRFILILDNYVLRRFAGLLLLILASFLVLTLVFTFFELLSDIVKNKIPPTTTIPNGTRLVAAAPRLNAIGNAPSEVASDVIRIGRSRCEAASITAARLSIPSARF